MNRRGFLQSCLALAVAPALVRAESMMRINARPFRYEGWPPPYSETVEAVEFTAAKLEREGLRYSFSAFVRAASAYTRGRVGESEWVRKAISIEYAGDVAPRVFVRSTGELCTFDGVVVEEFKSPPGSVENLLRPRDCLSVWVPPSRADGIVGFCDNGLYFGCDGYFVKETGVRHWDVPPIFSVIWGRV